MRINPIIDRHIGQRWRKKGRSRSAFSAALLCSFVLGFQACGGGGTTASTSAIDANPAANEIDESARPGSAVGITVVATELSAAGPVTYSLTNDGSGRFSIDAASGVVSLAAGVDYETALSHSITVRADAASGARFAEGSFVIQVLDSPAPQLSLQFPFPHAGFSQAQIGISGRVDHPQPENIVVTASAGSADKTGRVLADGRFVIADLALPANSDPATLRVVAAHAGGEEAMVTIDISRRPNLSTVSSMDFDEAQNRVIMADRFSGAILAYSFVTQTLVEVSGAGRGDGPMLDEPVGVAFDANTRSIYVVDNGLDAVLVVAEDGSRSILSDGDLGAGDNLLTPTDIVFDAARGQLFVADDGRNRVVSVDLISGDRATVTGDNMQSGPPISFYRGMGLDAVRDRLIVFSGDTVFGVNSSTGARTVISTDSDDPPSYRRSFKGIAVGTNVGKAFLADDFSNAVVEVNLLTGQRTSVTSSGVGPPAVASHPVIGTGQRLEWLTDTLFIESQNRAFVMEEGSGDPFLEVQSGTGNRSLVFDGRIGAGVNFASPAGLSLDPASNLAYLVDSAADVVVEIDLASGDRRLIAGSADGRGTIATAPLDIAFDPASRQAYVVDFTLNSLSALDVDTGASRVVSDAITGAGLPLGNPSFIELDPVNNRAYVLDTLQTAVFAIDLSSGQRTIVAAHLVGAAGLELDAANDRLLVSFNSPGIESIDLASGARTVISSNQVGLGQGFRTVGDIALDVANDRVLALDGLRQVLFSVELATGNREIISGDSSLVLLVVDETTGESEFIDVPREEGGGVLLARPKRIALDTESQIAYVTDDAYDGVIAIDLASGYRQLIAK